MQRKICQQRRYIQNKNSHFSFTCQHWPLQEDEIVLCVSALGWQVPYFNLISSEKWLWNGWIPLEALGEGISREYFPKGSLVLNNRRCCMMKKKLKALPASSPWRIFRSSNFLKPFCPLPTASQFRNSAFSTCPSKAQISWEVLSCHLLYTSLAVAVCPELWHPAAHHQRELGRRGTDPAAVCGHHKPGKCSMARKDTEFFHLCHCPDTSERTAHELRAEGTPVPSWFTMSVLLKEQPQNFSTNPRNPHSSPTFHSAQTASLLGAPWHTWRRKSLPAALGCGEDPVIT